MMDITKENVWAILQMLVDNKGAIMENAILDVFDIFTKYHNENRCYTEGWKTNDAFKDDERFLVNKKIILPGWVSYGKYMTTSSLKMYGDKIETNFSYHSEYSDVDKCMAYITNTRMENIRTIYETLEQKFNLIGNVRTGDKFDSECDSTFFHIKFYKKGTIHLTFKDDKLWEQFNIRACWQKKWLTPGQDFQGNPCDAQGNRIQIEASNPKTTAQEVKLLPTPVEDNVLNSQYELNLF